MTHNPTPSTNALLLRRRFVGLGAAGVLAAGLPLPFITRVARARPARTGDRGSAAAARCRRAQAFFPVTDGKTADYIPYLATVPSTLFGIAMVMPDGKVIEAGDTNYAFAIESIAKVFTLSLVMSESGPDVVKQKLGANATGLPFNSVIALELHKGNPLEPLVNAGAMATVSLVKAGSANERWQKIAANMDAFADAELSLNQAVFKSESDTNQHNRAIAYLLQSAGFMYSDPTEACDVYTRECSVGITPKNLAIMAGTLANGGVNPLSKKRLLDQAYVPKILAEMAVEGLDQTRVAPGSTTLACRPRAGWRRDHGDLARELGDRRVFPAAGWCGQQRAVAACDRLDRRSAQGEHLRRLIRDFGERRTRIK